MSSKIYGYYPNDDDRLTSGLLHWSATNLYELGGSFSVPPGNTRTDFTYHNDKRLFEVLGPMPLGSPQHSSRPKTVYNWVGNLLDEMISPTGDPITYEYDPMCRATQTSYSDGTNEQVWYDDVNSIIYRKDRVGVVSLTQYGGSGRLWVVRQAHGRDADLSDQTNRHPESRQHGQ